MRIVAVAGPGIVVMLADTDAGSIITAAQSGAQWQYQLLMLQVILVPILYMVQELTVRLGIVTRMGHGELIEKHFGRVWAWVSVSTLILACVGALVTELSGIAGVGALFGVSAPVSMVVTVLGLIAMVFTGSYLTVERAALAIGLFELVFFFVAWRAHPDGAELVAGALDIPLRNPQYLYLAAANIGAVIMPWMVFYQQSAVVEKGLTVEDLPAARVDTAVGALVTQLIMGAVLIATAATLGKNGGAKESLDTVQQIAESLSPFLGERTGIIMFALGMTGAALVATIVVTLTAARTLGEVMGYKYSLEFRPREAPWFYGVYALALILGGVLVASGTNLVKLSVAVQVMNALLLPIVLGFLYLLAKRALPPAHQMGPLYGKVVAAVTLVTVVFGLYAGISGAFSP